MWALLGFRSARPRCQHSAVATSDESRDLLDEPCSVALEGAAPVGHIFLLALLAGGCVGRVARCHEFDQGSRGDLDKSTHTDHGCWPLISADQFVSKCSADAEQTRRLRYVQNGR
jgi:hypothetical protein